MDSYFEVDHVGCRDGLDMLRKSSISVSLRSYSINDIDMSVLDGNGVVWRLIGIYGEPITHLREPTWILGLYW